MLNPSYHIRRYVIRFRDPSPLPPARGCAPVCRSGQVGKDRQRGSEARLARPSPPWTPAPTRLARPNHDQGAPHLLTTTGGRGSPKFYQPYSEDTQQQIIRETFHLVSQRDENVCNFPEGGLLIGVSDNKLIYRHYATLYFVFCVDSSESELGILDLI